MYRYILLLCLAILFLPSNAQSQSTPNPWALVKEKSQIKVYSRQHKHHSGKETKAVMQVKSTLNGLVALMKDSNAGTKWLSRIIVYKAFRVVSQAEWYTYAVASLPFPFDNRDLVLHNKVSQNKDFTVKISLVSATSHIKEKAKLKRIKVAEGFWQFTPIDNNTVEVIYQFYSEPHLELPVWVEIPTIANGLITTMKNLRNKVKAKKYQSADLLFIKEKG